MLAKILTGPHYSEGPDVINPSWAQVEAAIRELNNADLSAVLIGITPDHEPPWMGIAGGNGQYLVFVFDQGNEILVNTNVEETDQTIELVAGGQSANYPKRKVVDLELALRAARTFAESGELKASFTWIHD